MTKTTTRNMHLWDILSGRRRELQKDVSRRVRGGRTGRPNDVRDEADQSDTNISEDVDFALLQMKTETLRRIDEAVGRLNVGDYGYCAKCAVEISETRLRALPFAVRCTSCEERREEDQAQTRRLAQHLESRSLLFLM